MADDLSVYYNKLRRQSLYHPAKVLTTRTIEERLNFLSLSVNNKLVFVELDLSCSRLTNIDVLAGYVHLQVLKLAHNSLTSLNVLSHLPNLIYLDVPHNRNHKLFDFNPPGNLREANYNHNVIGAIPLLNNYWTLTKLQLDYNNIRRISYGLTYCKQLTYLSMCGNDIKAIDNLQHLPLRVLLLAANDISEIAKLETLVYLEVLDLSRNAIQKLTGVQGHYYLKDLDVSQNRIKSLNEFAILEKLPALRTLNILENPVCNDTSYRNIILATQPALLKLDGRRLSIFDKVKAINHIRPQTDIVSVRDGFVNSSYTFLQPLKIKKCTTDEKYIQYPFLLLLGPLGSLKSALVNRVVEEFPDFWKKATWCTTRNCKLCEGKTHRTMTPRQFERLHVNGNFIQTTHLYGEHYGLLWDEIDKIAENGFYPIADMELEAILTLKWMNFRLYLIVAMPHDVNIHRTRLESVLGFNEAIVQEAIERRNLYFDYYNVDSGLCVEHLNTNDLDTAYNQLKEIVIAIKNRIIAENIENKNSIFQWKPSMDVDENNKTEVAALQYRREHALSAFINSRPGKVHPMTSQFSVDIADNDVVTPRSEISL